MKLIAIAAVLALVAGGVDVEAQNIATKEAVEITNSVIDLSPNLWPQ